MSSASRELAGAAVTSGLAASTAAAAALRTVWSRADSFDALNVALTAAVAAAVAVARIIVFIMARSSPTLAASRALASTFVCSAVSFVFIAFSLLVICSKLRLLCFGPPVASYVFSKETVRACSSNELKARGNVQAWHRVW
mmetsp:Transcript_10577/g.35091  ORF Transcript_10577/g.35091 Transcript_10577/m.35091 type:complete len:141 (-) Transcript_10577:450-872(-)